MCNKTSLGSVCEERDDYNVGIEMNRTSLVSGKTRIDLTCSPSVSNVYPFWRINDDVIDTAHLPSEIIATKLNLSFVYLEELNVEVRCFIRINIDGNTIDICSDTVTIGNVSNTERK